MKPMLKYRGGKSKEIKFYEKYFRIEYDRYFEPFFGGGATYFYFEPNKAVINDLNNKLISFYNDVKYNFNQLKLELNQLQYIYEENQLEFETLKKCNPNKKIHNNNEDLYYEMRKEFNYPSGKYLHGTVYHFINKTAYSGMIRYNKKGEFNVPYGRYKNFNTNLITNKHYELLKNTEIYNLDYAKIFEMATPNDIMFLDPPYDCVFNDYGNNDGFNEEDQRRLAEEYKNLNTRALMIVAKTPLTEELYSKFIVEEYDKNYAVNIRNRFKSEAKHIIIKNY